MSTSRNLRTAVAAVAVGAAAGATTYVLVPAASAGVDTAATTSISTVADEKAGPGCGPLGLGTGEMPGWLEDRLDDLPAELRADLEAAWKIEDRSDRRDALEKIWNAAKAGDYGTEVQELAEDGPFGRGWGPGRGWGGGRGWHGHGPWGR